MWLCELTELKPLWQHLYMWNGSLDLEVDLVALGTAEEEEQLGEETITSASLWVH